MSKLWRQLAIATNWPVLVAVVVLTTIGIIAIWADTHEDPQQEWKKQIIFFAVGIGAMALFQGINYQLLGRLAWGFYLCSLLLLLYTNIPLAQKWSGIGGVPLINGSHAWINFGVMSLQPAELTKISFVMVLARYLRFRSNYRSLKGLIQPFLLAVIPVALILKQPDLGTALTFIPALFTMLFVAGAKIKHLLAIVGMGLALVPLMWFSGSDLPVFRLMPELVRPYQRDRVYAMFSSDPAVLQAKGFQQDQALIATGSGGWSGKGAGNVPIGRHVPEAHNDMIFALIGEQFGFVGCVAVLGAYIVLFTAGVEIAASTKEPFGRLVALGIVSLIAGQAFLNLAVVLRIMPVTGITLPFVSYGGSSLLASCIAAGLLLNVGQNRPLIIAREAFEF